MADQKSALLEDGMSLSEEDMDAISGRRSTDRLASEALIIANRAIQAVSAHELVCKIRYDGISSQLMRIEKVMLWFGSVMFVGMAGIIVASLLRAQG